VLPFDLSKANLPVRVPLSGMMTSRVIQRNLAREPGGNSHKVRAALCLKKVSTY
jgi:hypothetical protein